MNRMMGTVDAEEWAAEVERHLAQGRRVEFMPKGLSMWPTLRPGLDTVHVEKRPEYHRMDIVLARSGNPDGLFLHRVMRAEPDRYILMGDSNLFQTEECRPEEVLGKVVCILRGGRDITASPQTRLLRAMHRLHPAARRLTVRILNKLTK